VPYSRTVSLADISLLKKTSVALMGRESIRFGKLWVRNWAGGCKLKTWCQPLKEKLG